MTKRTEIKKIDAQGRLKLPLDWRERQLIDTSEAYVIKGEGFLKVVAKRKIDLRKFFDKADLGVDAIEDWRDFEKLLSSSRCRQRIRL